MRVPRSFRVLAVVAAIPTAGVALAASPASAATPVRDIGRFACAPGLTTPFADIGGTTHEASIACAVHYELTGGTSATTFSPQADVSRGQMATFLARLIGLGDVPPGQFPSAGFVDTAGTPHERSIDALVALHIAQGTSARTFAPTAPVTRAQMATFLARTIGFLGFALPANAPDAFTDDEGDAHETHIDQVALVGVAGGTSATTYGPPAPVSRGAMATFLARVVDLGLEEGFYRSPFVDTEAFAALAGPGGLGTAVAYTTDVPNVLCYEVILEGLSPTTAAHVHAGAPGSGGAELVTLPTPQADGFTGGCVSDPDSATAVEAPAFVDVHTQADPGGAVSGALGTRGPGTIGELDDIQVVPGPGDGAFQGIAGVFTTSQPDVVCISTAFLTLGHPTAVHLHEGAPHTNGPVVADFGPVAAFGVPISCRGSDRAAAVVADPAAFYVDVHTTERPGGAVRAQLEPA